MLEAKFQGHCRRRNFSAALKNAQNVAKFRRKNHLGGRKQTEVEVTKRKIIDKNELKRKTSQHCLNLNYYFLLYLQSMLHNFSN